MIAIGINTDPRWLGPALVALAVVGLLVALSAACLAVLALSAWCDGWRSRMLLRRMQREERRPIGNRMVLRAIAAALMVGAIAAGCATDKPVGTEQVQVREVRLVTAPQTFRPDPAGVAARVAVHVSVFDEYEGLVAGLVGGEWLEGWLLVGCTNSTGVE